MSPSASRTAAVVFAVASLYLVAFFLLRSATHVLLLLFAGVLFATVLRGLASWVAQKLGWRTGPSLASCMLLLVVLAGGAGMWIVPQVAEQAGALADRLTQAAASARQMLSGSSVGQTLLRSASGIGQQAGKLASEAAGALASTVGALGSLLVVVVVALYLAVSPAPYRHGLVRLVSPAHRQRAGEVLDALAYTLRRWFLGRLVSMFAVGIVTSLGLWALGVPLPLTLGVIAGVLGFIPNIGPLVSVLPALLLALTVSPIHLLYVMLLYLGINMADGYLLTPWLQQRAVSVPPALIIAGQLLFGALAGVLGVMVATPLLACLVVVIRDLYVEDRVERRDGRAAAARARSDAIDRAPD